MQEQVRVRLRFRVARRIPVVCDIIMTCYFPPHGGVVELCVGGVRYWWDLIHITSCTYISVLLSADAMSSH
jgi:hypothetical protein